MSRAIPTQSRLPARVYRSHKTPLLLSPYQLFDVVVAHGFASLQRGPQFISVLECHSRITPTSLVCLGRKCVSVVLVMVLLPFLQLGFEVDRAVFAGRAEDA